MKKNNLVEKFQQIEKELKEDSGLQEFISSIDQIKDKQDTLSAINDESEAVEEVVIWKKSNMDFNNRSTNFLSSRKIKKGFEESLRKKLTGHEIVIDFQIDTVTNKMISALENYSSAIQESLEKLVQANLSKVKITVKSSIENLFIDFAVSCDIELIQERKRFFQFCYYMKTRFEDTLTKVKIIHDKERIELSPLIGLRFTYDLNQEAKNSIDKKLNNVRHRSGLKESSEV